jgi:hypothetical protein
MKYPIKKKSPQDGDMIEQRIAAGSALEIDLSQSLNLDGGT